MNQSQMFALPHCRDKTELLEHAESVIETPIFHDLSACDASDFDCRDSHLFASGGDASKRALLCSVGRKSGDDLFPFRDHVLNRDMQIRETLQHHGYGLSRSLRVNGQTRREGMIDMIGGVEVIKGCYIPLVKHFLVETAYKGLILFS